MNTHTASIANGVLFALDVSVHFEARTAHGGDSLLGGGHNSLALRGDGLLGGGHNSLALRSNGLLRGGRNNLATVRGSQGGALGLGIELLHQVLREQEVGY